MMGTLLFGMTQSGCINVSVYWLLFPQTTRMCAFTVNILFFVCFVLFFFLIFSPNTEILVRHTDRTYHRLRLYKFSFNFVAVTQNMVLPFLSAYRGCIFVWIIRVFVVS